MPDDLYKATGDFTNLLQGAQRVDTAFKRLAAGFKEVTAATVQYNTKGTATEAVMKGISAAGNEQTITMAKLGNTWKITGSAVNQTAANLAAARTQIQQMNAAVNAVNNAVNALNRNNIQNLNANIQNATQNTQTFLLSWRNIIRFFEARLLYNSITGISSAIVDGTRRTIEFSQELARIRTLTPQGSFDEWSASIQRVSNALGTEALDTAKGYYSALSNQIGDSVVAIETFTKVTAEFAKVTGASAEQANTLFSAAINSFKLSASDAEQIAAKFFKAIDLGRITAEKLSGSFGRVAAAAGTLGVSLDETLAALAQMSKLGVTDADAMTQLLNMMNKLLKPTDAMKEALKRWGYSSGEAAVAAEGFTGILAKLNKELEENGTGALAQQLGDLRAIRGGLSLTGKNYEEYITILEAVKGSTESYNRAVAITKETVGFKLQKQLQELSNSFLNLGGKIASGIVAFTDATTTISGWIKLLTSAAVLTIPLFTKSIAGLAATTGAATKAFTALRASIVAAFTTPLGIILTITSSIAAFFILSESQEEKRQRLYGETLDILNAKNKEILEKLSTTTKKSIDYIETLFSATIRRTANLRSSLNESLDGISGVTKVLNKRISDFAAADLRVVDQQIDQIRQRIADLKSIENRALNDLEKDSRKASVISFEDKVEDLPVFQRAKAIQKRIDELIQQAGQQERAGQLEDSLQLLQEARDLQARYIQEVKSGLKEINALEKQNIDSKLIAKKSEQESRDIQRDIQQLQRERQAASTKPGNQNKLDELNAKALLQANKYEEAQRKNKEQTDALIESEKKLRELRADERGLDLEKQIQAQREKMVEVEQRIANQAAEARKVEEKRIQDAEDQKQLLEIQYDTLKRMTSLGGDNPLFNSDEIKNADEAMAVFKKTIADIDAARNRLGVQGSIADVLGFKDLVQLTQARIAANFAEKAAANYQESVLKQKQTLTDSVKAQEDLIQKSLAARTEAATTLGSLSAGLGIRIGGVTGTFTSEKDQRVIEIIRAEMERLVKQAAQVPEKVGEIRPKFLALKAELDNLRIDNAIKIDDDFYQTILNVAKTFKDLESTQKVYDAAASDKNDALQALNDIKQSYENITVATNDARLSQVEMTRSLLANLAAVEAQAKSAIEAVNAARIAAQASVPAGTANQAGGGMMRFAGGGTLPYGSDKIPAMLSPGEFVVNAGASKKFYSQLVAMNSGSRNYAGGGTVNTNVGDVNISMQSSGNTHTDVVRLGKLLRREIKRGTVRL